MNLKVEKKMEGEASVADVESSVGPPIHGLPILDFKKVDRYTTFTAEYAVDGQDLVFHFFLPPEIEARTIISKKYWLNTFPEALEPAALEVFRTGPPRLQAQHISDYDLNSWWLRANGFGSSLDVDGLAGKFLELLDQLLDAKKTT